MCVLETSGPQKIPTQGVVEGLGPVMLAATVERIVPLADSEEIGPDMLATVEVVEPGTSSVQAGGGQVVLAGSESLR